MNPRLRACATWLLYALLSATFANAQQPAATRVAANKARADAAIATYLAAQSRENTLQAALQQANEQAARARNARWQAANLQRQFAAARGALTERGRALREGNAAILSLRDTELALSAAVEEEARLADAALAATLDNAAASLQQSDKAQLADEAADRLRAQADSVDRAAERVTASAKAWARAGEDVRHRHNDYLERAAEVARLTPAMREAAAALIADSGAKIAKPLRDKQSAFALTADAAQTQADTLAPQATAPERKEPPFVDSGSDARPARGPAWVAAEHNRQIEAQALAWWQAALRSCQGKVECMAPVAQDQEQSEGRLKAAAERVRIERDATRAEIDRLALLAKRWEELQARSDEDMRRLDPLAQSLEHLIAAAESADEAARAMAAQADKDYRAARQAAEVAYLAAYGEPRQSRDKAFVAAVPVPPPAPAAAAAARAPRAHAFESVTRENLRRMPTYGAYTYVLFRQRPGAAATAVAVRKNYEALLQAIVAGTAHISAMQDWKPETLNLFCIPSLSTAMPDPNHYDIRNYDSDLAFALLATAGRGSIISPAILDRLNKSPGPFLLTTFKPIDRVASNDRLFFVDLSPYGPESYPALVASYKAQLVSAPPSGQTTWKPETLQWAFAVGGTVYADAKKVAEGIKQLFEDWLKGQGTKVALMPPA